MYSDGGGEVVVAVLQRAHLLSQLSDLAFEQAAGMSRAIWKKSRRGGVGGAILRRKVGIENTHVDFL